MSVQGYTGLGAWQWLVLAGLAVAVSAVTDIACTAIKAGWLT